MNCIRNYPWYKGWQKMFAGKDFVMLGIHTPETDTERVTANVRKAAAEAGLTFPILIDQDESNWDHWGNSMWPSVYLIDKEGTIRFWWYGELNWNGAEGEIRLRKRIKELLDEPNPIEGLPGAIR
ncbi:MAG: redoxin domain-containing protein [Pirellulales bacterium]